MSYTNPEQDLESPIKKMVEAIKEFDKAVDSRIESREYNSVYIEEISELSIELRRLKVKLLDVLW